MSKAEPCKYILLVEDDEDLRTQFRTVFEDEGYRVETAENGQVALDHLLARKSCEYPGCIVLDLMMPVMTGVEFLHKIAAEHPETLAKISVIVTTAQGSPKDQLAQLPAHVARIRKPMELDELLEMVERHCGAPAPRVS